MFNNLKKVLGVFLIITLTYVNLVLIGSNIVESLNSYAVEEQEEKTTNEDPTIEEEKANNNLLEEKDELVVIKNKDIHKTKISEAGEVKFNENLEINLHNISTKSNIIIEDILNEFYNKDEMLDEEISFQYSKSIINKEKLLSILGENGKLIVKDITTEKVLVEITSESINAQTIDEKVEQKFNSDETDVEEVRTYITVKEEVVEIEYVIDAEKIKFEINNITTVQEEKIINENKTENVEENKENVNDKFIIENTKSISNIKDVENLAYLKENKKITLNEEENNIESIINFKDTITRATLELDNTEWILGSLNTVNYTITLDTTSEKAELFKNPMFLIELPSNVESINTANSKFSVNNDGGVFTEKRVFTTTVLGKKYVVITLGGEQTVESIQKGDTTINLSLELNVSADETEGNKTTKLYYQNDTVTAYENGTSFDTDEVEISLILNNENKDDIWEETVIESEVMATLTSSTEKVLQPNEEFKYTAMVINTGNNELLDLELIYNVPVGIEIQKVLEEQNGNEQEKEFSYDETTRELTINIDKIEKTIIAPEYDEETEESTNSSIGMKNYKILVKTATLADEIYSTEINSKIKVLNGEEVLAESEEVVNIVSGAFLVIETENVDDKKEGEELTLGLKISNKGLIDKEGQNIEIEIPSEITVSQYRKAELNEEGKEESVETGTVSDKFELNIFEIPAQKTYYIQLIGKVNNIDKSKQITVKGNVNGEEFSWLINLEKENSNTEEPENPEQPENPNNPEEPSTPSNPEKPNEPTNPENPTNPEENENLVFDLSLNQYLNKVTVTNAKGTTVYNYEDTNFAKVEIHSKQMDGSKVTLEYKIIVKNEGTIPGYARKIVEYIPADLIFNEELNTNWYVGDDGNIYSIKLLDKLLKPGETAELTVAFEKQMTNENVGTITTMAEIYEASNDQNIEDINSIPGDKLEGQNDISKVEVLVTVSTGTVILYVILAIVFATIIGLGFHKVKKITLNKKGGC